MTSPYVNPYILNKDNIKKTNIKVKPEINIDQDTNTVS